MTKGWNSDPTQSWEHKTLKTRRDHFCHKCHEIIPKGSTVFVRRMKGCTALPDYYCNACEPQENVQTYPLQGNPTKEKETEKSLIGEEGECQGMAKDPDGYCVNCPLLLHCLTTKEEGDKDIDKVIKRGKEMGFELSVNPDCPEGTIVITDKSRDNLLGVIKNLKDGGDDKASADTSDPSPKAQDGQGLEEGYDPDNPEDKSRWHKDYLANVPERPTKKEESSPSAKEEE